MTILNRGYREYKLNNGLVVALQDTPAHMIVGELEIDFGAVHERKGEEGLAHFLEHCFATAGSGKYTPERSDEFRGNIGYFNILTDIGGTYFVSAMLPEDIEQWLDFISDSVFNPCFDPEKVNGERQRILREIADYKSDSSLETGKIFKRAFYRSHPIHISGLGKEEVVSKTDIGKLKQFHSRGYHPNNMDLILAGALPKNIRSLVEKYFGKQKPGKKIRTKFPRLKPLRKKTVIHSPAPELYEKENPGESSAEVELAFVVVPETHSDSTALSIISHILGESGSTSRFFKTLGLEKGLAYHVESSYGSSYNAGTFEIAGKVSARRLEEAIDCIFGEMKKFREKGLTQQELERCRRKAKYELAEIFGSPIGYIMAIEKRLDTGWTHESCISDFDAITLKKIREVAKKYLPKDRQTGKYVLSIRDPLKKGGTKVL